MSAESRKRSVNPPLGVNAVRGKHPTTGDNPVDTVDNSIAPGARSAQPSPDRSHPDRGADSLPSGLRGSDLARAALEAARAEARARGVRNHGKRTTPIGGSGSRRRWSGPRDDDRDPQPLGKLAARLAAARGWTDQLAGGQVFAKWGQLVGEDVAQHAKPITLREGELLVQAESTAWATQLRLLQRALLSRIAAAVGPGVVKRLKVQGPSAPNWRFGPLHAPGRGPRDTYG